MKFKVPHTLVLLFLLMILSLVATWIVPSGAFDTLPTESGIDVVEPGSFQTFDEKEYLPVTSLLTVVPRAFADAQGIIFFVLIIGGALAIVRETGVIDAILGKLIERYGASPGPLLFFMMFAFAAASATLGMAEEYIPFAIILVSLSAALRFDAITAIGTMVVGYSIGYGIAITNPFTLIIAQDIAGLPPTSGMGYRIVVFVPLLAIGFHHVWSYAAKIRKDPSEGLLYGLEVPDISREITDYPPVTLRRQLVLILTLLVLIGIVIGIATQGWYLVELGGIFLGLAIVTGLISGIGTNRTAKIFGNGAAELASTALLIGFARSVGLIMEDGEILHTVVHAVSTPLAGVGSEIAAVGMLLVQSALNFFIPSGSGQAIVSMPLMAPIGDIVGLTRQTTVLAFQLGDGLMNMVVPTNPVLMGILGLAGIPYEKWFRFILPLIIKLLVTCSIILILGVWIGYS